MSALAGGWEHAVGVSYGRIIDGQIIIRDGRSVFAERVNAGAKENRRMKRVKKATSFRIVVRRTQRGVAATKALSEVLTTDYTDFTGIFNSSIREIREIRVISGQIFGENSWA